MVRFPSQSDHITDLQQGNAMEEICRNPCDAARGLQGNFFLEKALNTVFRYASCERSYQISGLYRFSFGQDARQINKYINK